MDHPRRWLATIGAWYGMTDMDLLCTSTIDRNARIKMTKAVGNVLKVRKGDTVGFFLKDGEIVIKKLDYLWPPYSP